MVTFISRFRLSGIFNLNLLLFSVIRVKVLNDRWENGLSNQLMKHKLYQPRYDVYIIAVWKGETVVRKAASLENRVLAKRFHSQIHTSVSSCGLRLEKGDKYILTGHIIENKLFVSTCHWKQKWGKKAKKIRKYFKKNFHATAIYNHASKVTVCTALKLALGIWVIMNYHAVTKCVNITSMAYAPGLKKTPSICAINASVKTYVSDDAFSLYHLV